MLLSAMLRAAGGGAGLYAALSHSHSEYLTPQMVGTPIVFAAVASGGSGNNDYQFTANLTSTPLNSNRISMD